MVDTKTRVCVLQQSANRSNSRRQTWKVLLKTSARFRIQQRAGLFVRALRLTSDPIPGGGANVRGHFEQRNSIANFEGGGITLCVLHSGARLICISLSEKYDYEQAAATCWNQVRDWCVWHFSRLAIVLKHLVVELPFRRLQRQRVWCLGSREPERRYRSCVGQVARRSTSADKGGVGGRRKLRLKTATPEAIVQLASRRALAPQLSRFARLAC